MNAETKQEMRSSLGLSRDPLACIASVTPATVSCWETGAATPTGSALSRLRQMSATLANPDERDMLLDILPEPGGSATLAALPSLGNAFDRAALPSGVPSLFSHTGIAGSASAMTALRVLNKILSKQKGVRRMSELPLRESDTDLVPLLRKCRNEDLEPLVQYILQKGWLSSELENTEVFKANQPNHTAYADEISSEIQRFGGHTFANLFRGGEGASYKSIVCAVAKRLKVNFNKERDVEVIEEQILLKILEKAWEKMTDKEKVELLKASGSKGVKIGKQFPAAAFQAIFKAGGFKSYKIMLIVANAVWKFIFGKGLTLGANAALARWAAVFVGPIGWAITAIWTAFDLGGPAYRVTIPCVIHIAMLRQLVALRDAGQDPAEMPTDETESE